jgi:hypothetical protein
MMSDLLTRYESLPEGLLSCPAADLHRLLPGPALIHLPGRRPEPLFVSVLLHGNEDTGWLAMRQVLERYQRSGLPRALSLFIGNIQAARAGLRRLEHQPDYNRVWPGNDLAETPEHGLMRAVVEEMRSRSVFASLDIHNNTGINPHYACVNRLEQGFLHLASLFSRTVVYFTRPLGVQSAAFAPYCPAVTVECGKPGMAHGTEHAAAFVDACLNLDHVPVHPLPPQDVDLYHTVATVNIPEHVSFAFDDRQDVQLRFDPDLERLNFRELAPGSELAHAAAPGLDCPLRASNEAGEDVSHALFDCRDGRIRLRKRLMPAMLTRDVHAIRLDCLCYLMERLPYPVSVL